MLSRTVVLEPTPQDPSRLAGRVHPYLRLEPWAGLSSSSQGPLPKYLKAMTWLSMCSHIPHPIGPIQQPLEVCRASFIVPVYRSRQQMTLVRHAKETSTSGISQTPWQEGPYPHGTGGETEVPTQSLGLG